MNSDYKDVTCVRDTVYHFRTETSHLLADRICLRLQTEGKGQSNVVDHLARGFVLGGPNTKATSVRRTHHCRLSLPHST